MRHPTYKYFDLSEFDSPDDPGSGENMDPAFVTRLDAARGISGTAFVINSGYRTGDHNKKVRGHGDSLHMSGRAADIKAEYPTDRYMIIWGLISAGFYEITIYKTHIHVEWDVSLAGGIWLDY